MTFYEQRYDILRIEHQNNQQKMVPIAAFFYIYSFLTKNYQLDLKAFLSTRNIELKTLQIKGEKIQACYVTELIDEAIALTRDYGILFKLAETATPNSLGILGYLMLHSKNIGEAMAKLCRYYPLIGKTLKPMLILDKETYKLSLVLNHNGEVSHLEKYSAEIHLCAILNLINKIIPQKIFPISVTFRHGKPFNLAEYQKAFGDKLFFDETENALIFDAVQLETKTICENPYLLKVFENEAEQCLGMNVHGGLKDKVSGYILIATGELDVSLESVAKKVGMHPRTLQKKLKEEGESFIELLSKVRQKLAVHYLLKGLDSGTIASYLGYCELSPFLRAFKKWYGMTPKEWLMREN